jgi:hypothetical protein
MFDRRCFARVEWLCQARGEFQYGSFRCVDLVEVEDILNTHIWAVRANIWTVSFGRIRETYLYCSFRLSFPPREERGIRPTDSDHMTMFNGAIRHEIDSCWRITFLCCLSDLIHANHLRLSAMIRVPTDWFRALFPSREFS